MTSGHRRPAGREVEGRPRWRAGPGSAGSEVCMVHTAPERAAPLNQPHDSCLLLAQQMWPQARGRIVKAVWQQDQPSRENWVC